MIKHFLCCTAHWTPWWFNKPKFHIILHLVAHVRHFGPAILFATKGFESFNAIIHMQRIHSNCHAPSRDIACGFAHVNRICHLLSGGIFMHQDPTSGWHACHNADSDPAAWMTAGRYPLALVHPRMDVKNVIMDYYGLSKATDAIAQHSLGMHVMPQLHIF